MFKISSHFQWVKKFSDGLTIFPQQYFSDRNWKQWTPLKLLQLQITYNIRRSRILKSLIIRTQKLENKWNCAKNFHIMQDTYFVKQYAKSHLQLNSEQKIIRQISLPHLFKTLQKSQPQKNDTRAIPTLPMDWFESTLIISTVAHITQTSRNENYTYHAHTSHAKFQLQLSWSVPDNADWWRKNWNFTKRGIGVIELFLTWV